jgi:hypothetical protein
MFKIDHYITDVLLRDLVGHDRRPASFLVYIWFTAEQQRRASHISISYQDLAESIGISKSSATPIYKVLTPWRSRTPRT